MSDAVAVALISGGLALLGVIVTSNYENQFKAEVQKQDIRCIVGNTHFSNRVSDTRNVRCRT